MYKEEIDRFKEIIYKAEGIVDIRTKSIRYKHRGIPLWKYKPDEYAIDAFGNIYWFKKTKALTTLSQLNITKQEGNIIKELSFASLTDEISESKTVEENFQQRKENQLISYTKDYIITQQCINIENTHQIWPNRDLGWGELRQIPVPKIKETDPVITIIFNDVVYVRYFIYTVKLLNENFNDTQSNTTKRRAILKDHLYQVAVLKNKTRYTLEEIRNQTNAFRVAHKLGIVNIRVDKSKIKQYNLTNQIMESWDKVLPLPLTLTLDPIVYTYYLEGHMETNTSDIIELPEYEDQMGRAKVLHYVDSPKGQDAITKNEQIGALFGMFNMLRNAYNYLNKDYQAFKKTSINIFNDYQSFKKTTNYKFKVMENRADDLKKPRCNHQKTR